MTSTQYKRKPGAVAERELSGTTMLVPVTSHLGKLDRFFNLNESAGEIWKALCDGTTMDQLVSTLCDTYDVPADTAQADAEEVVKKLLDFGAIEAQPAS